MKKRGLAQIPVLIGLLLLVVAIPVSVKIVQDNQDTRNQAIDGGIEGPGELNTYYIKIDGNCVGQLWTSQEDCERENGTTCYLDFDSCQGEGVSPSPSPPGNGTYYICNSSPVSQRTCSIKDAFNSELECQTAIGEDPNRFCVTDCITECLSTYSVCLPKVIWDKCPNGRETGTDECSEIFSNVDNQRAYWYGDREYSFEARCFSVDVGSINDPTGILSCEKNFGKNNCFESNDSCMNHCPMYDEGEDLIEKKLYQCGANQSCSMVPWANFEDCYRENGRLGCYNFESACNYDCNDTDKETYYYCQYDNPLSVAGQCQQGEFSNIYECYSQHGHCSFLSCYINGNPCQRIVNPDSEEEELKLYFCLPGSGCKWEIFGSWQECGNKYGTCYDVKSQCEKGSRCISDGIIEPELFYYLDEGKNCVSGYFDTKDDCEIFVNDCDKETTLDYCRLSKGDVFKENVCFVDDKCGQETVPTETPIETPVETPIETPTETPIETPVETPPEDECVVGARDLTGDGIIDLTEFEIWRDEYFNKSSKGEDYQWQADFDCNEKIDLIDFEIWRSYYFDTKIEPIPEDPLSYCLHNGQKYDEGDLFCVSNNLGRCILKEGIYSIMEMSCADGWACVESEAGAKCDYQSVTCQDSEGNVYDQGDRICIDGKVAICERNKDYEGEFIVRNSCQFGQECVSGDCETIVIECVDDNGVKYKEDDIVGCYSDKEIAICKRDSYDAYKGIIVNKACGEEGDEENWKCVSGNCIYEPVIKCVNDDGKAYYEGQSVCKDTLVLKTCIKNSNTGLGQWVETSCFGTFCKEVVEGEAECGGGGFQPLLE